MLIKLFVFVFLLVNGVPAEEPVTIYSLRNHDFESVEACEAFTKTEENTTAFTELHDALAAQNPGVDFTLEQKCLPAPDAVPAPDEDAE